MCGWLPYNCIKFSPNQVTFTVRLDKHNLAVPTSIENVQKQTWVLVLLIPLKAICTSQCSGLNRKRKKDNWAKFFMRLIQWSMLNLMRGNLEHVCMDGVLFPNNQHLPPTFPARRNNYLWLQGGFNWCLGSMLWGSRCVENFDFIKKM